MADAEDTQPSPTETPPAGKITVPLAKPDVETKKDLLTTWATSPAEFGNQVTPTARSLDESAGSPTLSGHLVKEKQCVLALTVTMEILNLEAPSVAVGCQGATVEELTKEDLAEGCPWMHSSLLTSLK